MESTLRRLQTNIQRRFNKGCVDYQLLSDGDRILIGLSGGKDSLMLVRLLAARMRIYSPRIEVEAVHVMMDNIAYQTDGEYLENFCAQIGIKLHLIHTRFDVREENSKSPCFLCSWYRRKALFEFAVEHGFNKVALGHHQDDILVTYLMNLTFEGSAHSMSPRLQMEHYPLQIIRPMCLVHEEDIEQMAQLLEFRKLKKLCPSDKETRRADIKAVFHQLQRLNPEARYSLWRALMK